jgi:hypothetical protein
MGFTSPAELDFLSFSRVDIRPLRRSSDRGDFISDEEIEQRIAWSV